MRIAIVFFIDFPSCIFIAKPNIAPNFSAVNESLRKQFPHKISTYTQHSIQYFVLSAFINPIINHISRFLKFDSNYAKRNWFRILFTFINSVDHTCTKSLRFHVKAEGFLHLLYLDENTQLLYGNIGIRIISLTPNTDCPDTGFGILDDDRIFRGNTRHRCSHA